MYYSPPPSRLLDYALSSIPQYSPPSVTPSFLTLHTHSRYTAFHYAHEREAWLGTLIHGDVVMVDRQGAKILAQGTQNEMGDVDAGVRCPLFVKGFGELFVVGLLSGNIELWDFGSASVRLG